MRTNHNITVSFLLIAILAFLFQLSGCKNGGDPTPVSKQDEVKGKLTSAPWKLLSATVDGIDQTTMYKGLTLTFTATGFTTTNGGALWPATGTWTFTSVDATAFTRDDGLAVTIQEATATSLKLGLSWTKTTLGRVGSMSGQHVFVFGK